MINMRKAGALFIAIILISVSLISGCSTVSTKNQVTTRGVSDSEIVIGTIMPLTGPKAGNSAPGRGLDAYIKYVNDNGGINGRKIKLIMEDDQSQPAQTVARARKLVEEDKVFLLASPLGTEPNLAIRDYLVQHQVPVVAPATGSSQLSNPPNKYYFTLQTNYFGEGGAHVKYAVEQLKDKNIAVAYQNDDAGKEAYEGVKAAAEKYKVQLAGEVSFESTAVNLSAEALKLKNSGASVVMIYSVTKTTANLINEMVKIGYKPQIILWTTAMLGTMFDLAGNNFDGMIGSQFLPDVSFNVPKVTQAAEIMKKYYPNEPAAYQYFNLVGIANGMVLVEGLKRAGRDLTVDSFIAAMETLKDWDGGLTAPVTYTPTHRQGQNAVIFVKADVKTKKFLKLTDYISLEK